MCVCVRFCIYRRRLYMQNRNGARGAPRRRVATLTARILPSSLPSATVVGNSERGRPPFPLASRPSARLRQFTLAITARNNYTVEAKAKCLTAAIKKMYVCLIAEHIQTNIGQQLSAAFVCHNAKIMPGERCAVKRSFYKEFPLPIRNPQLYRKIPRVLRIVALSCCWVESWMEKIY